MPRSNCYPRMPPSVSAALTSQHSNPFWDRIKQDVQSFGVPANRFAGTCVNPSKNDLAKCFFWSEKNNKVIGGLDFPAFVLYFPSVKKKRRKNTLVTVMSSQEGASQAIFAVCCKCNNLHVVYSRWVILSYYTFKIRVTSFAGDSHETTSTDAPFFPSSTLYTEKHSCTVLFLMF